MTEQVGGYADNRKPRSDLSRLVVEVPKDLIIGVDKWGVASGMTSRAATVRELLKMALSEGVVKK